MNEEPAQGDAKADELAEIEQKVETMLGNVARSARTHAVSPAEESGEDEALTKLEDSARQSRANYRNHTRPSSGEASLGSAVGFAVAYNLVGCVLGGWLLGFGFDKLTHGTFWGQVVGIILGALAGITSCVLLILRKGAAPDK